MGPQASKSYPGQRLVRPAGPKAERARQELDYGRRGVAGYVFGAFQPASGKAFTQPYERRTTTNWVDFLSAVEAWIDPVSERVYAIVDNLNTHSAPDVLLFSLLHPRWEFVFQPKLYRAVQIQATRRSKNRPPRRSLAQNVCHSNIIQDRALEFSALRSSVLEDCTLWRRSGLNLDRPLHFSSVPRPGAPASLRRRPDRPFSRLRPAGPCARPLRRPRRLPPPPIGSPQVPWRGGRCAPARS